MRRRILFGSLLLLVGCVSKSESLMGDEDYGSGGGGGDDVAAGGSGTGGPTVAYKPDIQADIDSLGCSAASCHGGTSLPMPIIASPASDTDWQANYAEVKARAGSVAVSPFMDKALGDGGHVAPLSDGDPVLARWEAWIAQGAPYEISAGTGGAGASGTGASGTGANGTGASGTGASGSGGGGAGGPVGEVTWDGEIYDLLVANACHDCHSNSIWQGAYSLSSYDAAMGFGTDDTPNIVPYDESSLLVAYTAAGHHGMSAADANVIRSWIVDLGAPEN